MWKQTSLKTTGTLALFVPVLAVSAAVAPRGGEEVELDEAKIFIEYNSTDGDFGIQFFWDGEAWKRMKVLREDERAVLRVAATLNLAQQGLTEGFFESAEPSHVPMQEFFDRFPEGEYEFEGRTLDGKELEGEDDLTHVLPAPPANLSPADGDLINSQRPLTVSFDAVTEDHEGNPLEPALYEVILETEDADELELDFKLIIAGDSANPSVTIPPEFLVADREYKFEVICEEESGNRTISETEFETF